MTVRLPTAVLLLALMIVSQSVLAVALPCSHLGPGPGSHTMDMTADPHAGHHMDAPSDETAAPCCRGGYCSMSGCLPPVAPVAIDIQLPRPVPVTAGPAPDALFAGTDPETLYRPPIAR